MDIHLLVMVLEFTRDNTIVISNHDQKVLKARLFLFGDFYFFHSFHFMEKQIGDLKDRYFGYEPVPAKIS